MTNGCALPHTWIPRAPRQVGGCGLTLTALSPLRTHLPPHPSLQVAARGQPVPQEASELVRGGQPQPPSLPQGPSRADAERRSQPWGSTKRRKPDTPPCGPTPSSPSWSQPWRPVGRGQQTLPMPSRTLSMTRYSPPEASVSGLAPDQADLSRCQLNRSGQAVRETVLGVIPILLGGKLRQSGLPKANPCPLPPDFPASLWEFGARRLQLAW